MYEHELLILTFSENIEQVSGGDDRKINPSPLLDHRDVG